jgi:hypothetical protein
MAKPAVPPIKEYPRRGSMQQFRFADRCSFACFRCGGAKVSRLLVVYSGNWDKLLCNGCYGRLLSIYDIKRGTDPSDVKAEALSKVLLELVGKDQVRETLLRMSIAENRLNYLSSQAQRFIATAQFVANTFGDRADLDWSAPVIGVCKAFELDANSALTDALRERCAGDDLRPDESDKDLGRVAKYCAGKAAKPPELGTLGHFVRTAVSSKERASTSTIIARFREALADWPRSQWLVEPDGFAKAIGYLTSAFRNRAAHTDELTRQDYEACSAFVLGSDGIMWRLLTATRDVKELRRSAIREARA